MRVLKFGGTSLANAERINGVAEIVERASQQGRVTIVVSALAGVTDALANALHQALAEDRSAIITDLESRHYNCAAAISETAACNYSQHLKSSLKELERLLHGVAMLGECPSGTRDRILATGERLAAPLVTMALRQRGLGAHTQDGSSLIATGPPGTETVDFTTTQRRVLEVLADRPLDEIAVVTGFIGGDVDGRTTTLGRGASDYSATLLGAALDADWVEIWTDVDGVLSAEPRLVPKAFPLPHLTYEEAADLACLGARVLHPQTLEPLASRGIPLRIRNTLHPELDGTLVDNAPPPTSRVSAVTALSRVVRLLFRPVDGHRVTLTAMDRLERPPLLAAWETPGQALSVITSETDEAELTQSIGSPAVSREELALVATVDGSGTLLSATAPAVLGALAASQIQVKGLFQPAAAPRTLGVLIERHCTPKAVRLLHDQLLLDQDPDVGDSDGWRAPSAKMPTPPSSDAISPTPRIKPCSASAR